jgi:hypothetical protein
MAAEGKEKGPRSGLYLASQLILGAAFGMAMLRIASLDDGPFYFLWQVFFALYVYVALHEAGHAIAAIQQGFRLLTFSVWPIALYRRSGGWRLRWLQRIQALGFVAADPVSPNDLQRRMTIFIAGGPVATAITALVAALPLLVVRESLPKWGVDELKLIALLSATSFVTGLIPSRGMLCVNDAARLQMLWRAGAESARFTCLMLLQSASRSGVRPRDLNPALIAQLPGPADGSIDWAAAQLFRFNFLCDSDRDQEAYPILQEVLVVVLAPTIREVLQLSDVVFVAAVNRDLATAREKMAAIPTRNRRDDAYQNTLNRAQAGIAFLEGRLGDAESSARKALHHCNRLEDLGLVIVIRESIEQLLAEIATAKSSGSPDSVARADPAQSRR